MLKIKSNDGFGSLDRVFRFKRFVDIVKKQEIISYKALGFCESKDQCYNLLNDTKESIDKYVVYYPKVWGDILSKAEILSAIIEHEKELEKSEDLF